MKSNTDFRDQMVDITGVSTIVKNSNTMEKPQQKSPGRLKLEKWLHSFMKIEMTDGRTLIGSFLCTDRDNNIILGSCSEYLKPDEDGKEEEPRMLGLAMVPGRHIVSICIDDSSAPQASTSSHVYT